MKACRLASALSFFILTSSATARDAVVKDFCYGLHQGNQLAVGYLGQMPAEAREVVEKLCVAVLATCEELELCSCSGHHPPPAGGCHDGEASNASSSTAAAAGNVSALVCDAIEATAAWASPPRAEVCHRIQQVENLWAEHVSAYIEEESECEGTGESAPSALITNCGGAGTTTEEEFVHDTENCTGSPCAETKHTAGSKSRLGWIIAAMMLVVGISLFAILVCMFYTCPGRERVGFIKDLMSSRSGQEVQQNASAFTQAYDIRLSKISECTDCSATV